MDAESKTRKRKYRGKRHYRQSKWQKFLSGNTKRLLTKQVRTWIFYVVVAVFSFCFAFYYLTPILNAVN